MRIVGIDPGSRFLGWGIIEQSGNRLQCINYGVLKLGDGLLADRLVMIDQELSVILKREKPESAAIEGMFYAKNAQSAAVLGHARGVCMLCLRRAGLDLAEYPPTQVKRSVVGKGRADKNQVAQVVTGILGLAEVPPSDAADALAVAITHASRAPFHDALVAAKPRRGRRRR
jgi:crossover junction endodeoxyribonuclease RuvC